MLGAADGSADKEALGEEVGVTTSLGIEEGDILGWDDVH